LNGEDGVLHMGKIVVNKPNRAKGSIISIPGLGSFANGETHEVSDDKVRKYRQEKGYAQNKQLVFGDPLPTSSSSSTPKDDTTSSPAASDTSSDDNDDDE